MIYVDRGRVEPPAVLSSKEVKEELRLASRHFASKAGLETRYKSKRNLWAHPEVKESLSDLFNDKCAFCESKIGSGSVFNFEHFRPRAGTADLEGNYLPGHYYWLAYDWRNLYSSCQRCNVSKKNQFPIDGTRAALKTPYEKLGDETPLLLDPCNDRPGLVLVFDTNGRVGGDDSRSDNFRGWMTIQLYDLNRPELVARRAKSAVEFLNLLKPMESGENPFPKPTDALLLSMTSDAGEFAAMHRQFGMQRLALLKKIPKRLVPLAKALEKQKGFHRGATQRAQQQAVKEQKRYTKSLEDYVLDQEETADEFYLQDLRVRRIAVRNVKALQDLDIELPVGAEAAPWTVFLGENGCGKSTLLHALAMALVGDKYRAELGLDARTFVRRDGRVHSGSIAVYLKGFDKPVTLDFLRSTSTPEGNKDEPKVPVLGYGATRLLPKERGPKTDLEKRLGRYARVGNLFDPSSPLTDATAWLLKLQQEDETKYGHVLRSLKYLLDLAPGAVVRANLEEKRIEIPSLQAYSLAELSDGYQSLIAVSVDIMSVMLHHFEAMESAKGLVLIDELGAHLHPRWRMRIVERLRTTFPWVQFIVSTHDPLCLRGTQDGEVIVLRKDERNRTYALTDLPPVAGMRVDQLLTSEHFGLSSTVDPEVEALFERYYELLRETELTDKEREEVQGLEEKLASYRLLGETRRERIMLEAIDKHLAHARERGSEDTRKKARGRLSARLGKILSNPNV